MANTTHILVPLDLSATSRYAVRAVKKLTFSFDQITLLHVYNPIPSSPLISFDSAPEQELLFAEIERRLRRSLMEIRSAELDGVEKVCVELECTALLSVAEAICQYARNASADLIVLTTKQKEGLSRVLMGSVAEDVVKYSPCPVLVVRAANYINTVEDREQPAEHDACLRQTESMLDKMSEP